MPIHNKHTRKQFRFKTQPKPLPLRIKIKDKFFCLQEEDVIMKKGVAILLCAGMLLCMGAGCAQPPAAPAAESSTEALYAPSLKEEKPLIQPAYGENADTELGANAFSFRLASALLEQDENMIVSPLSVWMALSALSNATDKSALPALLGSLGLPETDVRSLNEFASRMLYELTNAEGADKHNPYDPLSIANAVFVSDQYELNKEFAQTFLDYYRGAAMEVDFTSPGAVDAVNDWASEHTNGLIEEIIQRFEPGTLAAIANAIYFSDRWDWEFNADDTEERAFHGARSEAAAPFMLREGDGLPYYEDGDMQVMPLRFKLGGALYILLPKDGDAGALLSGMTAERFANMQESVANHTGKLLLPRFALNSDYDLLHALRQLGVPLLDAAAPALSGVIKGEDVFISQAVHKALIKVDEKGTTAAAVTVMAMAAGAMMPEPTAPFEMICDRPFAFLLTKPVYGAGEQVLFCGVVNQL